MSRYSRYWASSKLFDRLRKFFAIEKPDAAQWGEWDDWEKNTKSAQPFGYWMTEELPRLLQKIPEFFIDPFYNLRYRYRCRFIYKCHVLPTDFVPGTYHDFRERILHGLMQSLVDFVEIEKAHINRFCHPERPYKGGRDAEAGLEYIAWEMTLDNPDLPEAERSSEQAHTAREILDIYNWWKFDRPKRPDPYEVSGYDAFQDKQKEKYGSDMTIMDERINVSKEDRKQSLFFSQEVDRIETEYFREEEEMMIRLIKIRLHLWT